MFRIAHRWRDDANRSCKRQTRPTLESLEDRMLLYATTGGSWTQPVRITYSIVPDGTSIGGIPSNLQATLNAKFSTAAWVQQLQKTAALWEQMANINLVQVPDDGEPIGTSGSQQGDPRFGDIRIGGFAQSSGQLGFAFAPQPFNGGTNAGDIFFNTAQSWQINGSTYDLQTVALHEFGHALGVAESSISYADMYTNYTGTKSSLTSDDISAIRAIYGARQGDWFDAGGNNNTTSTASDITPYLQGSGQISLSGLNLVPPSSPGSDVDWYKVTVPTTTTGTMVVQMQSSNLSSLSPSVAVFDSTGRTLLGQQSSRNYGSTVSVTVNGLAAGQVYLVRATGATTSAAGYGSYGLLVNFGSSPQASIAPPNTTVAAQPDKGGGTSPEYTGGGGGLLGISLLGGGGNLLSVNLLGINIDVGLSLITVGTVSGWGDPMHARPTSEGQHRGLVARPGHAAGHRGFAHRLTASAFVGGAEATAHHDGGEATAGLPIMVDTTARGHARVVDRALGH